MKKVYFVYLNEQFYENEGESFKSVWY